MIAPTFNPQTRGSISNDEGSAEPACVGAFLHVLLVTVR